MPYATPTALIVLDGLGILNEKKYNAFYQAKTPHLDAWRQNYFYTTLHAHGKFVGLPEGYNGNSEVGHFTLGAGRIIQQSSTMLNTNLDPDKLYSNSTLTEILSKFNSSKTIHLLGMASDGNIHSSIEHAKNILITLARHNISKVVVHAFLDGRDTAPQIALSYLEQLEEVLKLFEYGKIASIHGRYYAMDRNNNWERTEQSFAILTQQQNCIENYHDWIKKQYDQGIFDEFIQPKACIAHHTIAPEDGIIFFNFRPDRAIQLTKKLLGIPYAFFITPIVFHDSLPTSPLMSASHADNTLLETLSIHQKTILTIAETEKYAHVTYFFNGHKNIRLANETRILIPSKTCQPIQDPSMQAAKITDAVLASVQTNPRDFYLINYANADMVGHSGNLAATIKAIEYLDRQLYRLYQTLVLEKKGTIYITADHGNAEVMFDKHTMQPCTSHTTNPVPFYMICKQKHAYKKLTQLADVAPFILCNMKIPLPLCMK